MKHQREIDGLRSLAILPVLAFHLGMPFVPGGYVGVDIFFVISGFLITRIVRDEIAAGHFSIMEFYKRRALRILPALTVVLLAVYCLAVLVFLPTNLKETGQSAIAAALFFSNFKFWMESGYFSAPAEANPLLHTWSLSVEEQFYICLPLLLAFLVAKWPRRTNAAMLALVLGSFLLSVMAVFEVPTAAFYLLPARAWELGVGVCLALFRLPSLPRWRDHLSVLGVGFIAAAIVLLNSRSVFPGHGALLPCIGASLIIVFSGGTKVGGVLSSRPFVWIGKISYSLYLWHWPLIVFYKARFGQELASTDMAIIAAMSVGLAAFSYYFIEQPFRAPEVRKWSAGRIVAQSGAVLAGLTAIGVFVSAQSSDLRQYPPEVLAISKFTAYRETTDYAAQFRVGSCLIGQREGGVEAFDKQRCLSLDPAKKNYLLMGDSHAAQYWRALQDRFPQVNLMQATASGCRPLVNGLGSKRCTDLMRYTFNEYLRSTKVDGVILAARWTEEELPLLRQTVNHLTTSVPKVMVLGPTVEYAGTFPILLAQSYLYGRDFDFNAYLDPTKPQLSAAIAQSLAETEAIYLPVIDQLCQGRTCVLRTPSGQPMQFDYGHLTLEGSRLVVNKLAADPLKPLVLP